MNTQAMVQELRAEAARLNQAADLLEAGASVAPRRRVYRKRGKRLVTTAERKRRSDAQRARWDAVKKKSKKKPEAAKPGTD